MDSYLLVRFAFEARLTPTDNRPIMTDPLANLARRFATGELSRDQFLRGCDEFRSATTPSGTLDVDRQRRCGFSEVIYGEGKSAEQIHGLVIALRDAQQPVLVTRVNKEKSDALSQAFPGANYSPIGGTWRLGDCPAFDAPTAIVCAGTSDLPVAEEARETLRWMGSAPYFVCDVGVAGPHRLLPHLTTLRRARAVVVVAGMEGALPSVVAGHLAVPVIAVPTSVGYGAALGGIAAMLGMLTSCAANVAVTNIDAGFKGAYLAGMIARQSDNQPNADQPNADQPRTNQPDATADHD
jgi:hypothetical protein